MCKEERDITKGLKEKGMKKLLVIINANTRSEAESIFNAAMKDQKFAEGTYEKILDNAFLIDIRTGLPLFVSLLYRSSRVGSPIAVFAVDDEDRLFNGPLQLPPGLDP